MVATEFKMPKLITARPQRPPEADIPSTSEQRRFIKQLVRNFVEEFRPVPPMPLDELREHADVLIEQHKLPTDYRNFIAVLINNQAWEEDLARIPYNRRLLLLPKCLRTEAVCPAPFDEFGLLCKQCGQCSLQDLQEEAERLGYAVLIAEGSALVMAIIETGKIDAIVGVSCLSVLERAFPFMEAAAIPGVAIPLLQGDCLDTNVDLDWVWDVVHLTSEDTSRRLNLEALRSEVRGWFDEKVLETVMGPAQGETEQIARRWMSAHGKRWRPFLAACAYKAMQAEDTPIPAEFIKLAVGIECFHKASLIHDDIEDKDDTRYGEKTLHAVYGEAMAINVGDYLVGEGYRLIAECGAAPVALVEMLRVAAIGQKDLCIGQGREMEWMRQPSPLKPTEVLEIFSKKTSPAFEVALKLGAAYAGAEPDIGEALSRFSRALGIAYQIRDDLSDAEESEDPDDVAGLRPSVLLALAYQRAKGEDRAFLEQVWRRTPPEGDWPTRVGELYAKLEVRERTTNLFESFKEEAILSLKELKNPSLKGLLRRVLGKIFNDVEIKEWCREFETRNAAGSQARSPFTV
ncbi:Polyprenyl synthetase family protein [Sulfidibacter corallicola]|uniref:Polyprenyl synthetase family protein n=1 Tax=Sulfidibacter corallicola TaxID=2818388 RepID=A0A8A4TTV0_SULCO|nr:polyprenyl synthetase family protein [Sulfidibacter corallicola]QTD52462.1 polyprenyl synthetase family protein [Sulfidibacter corallicola]